jgi:Tfp pilus assembly protein PilF
MDLTQWANRGSSFQRDGNFVEAVECFREALKLQPENVPLQISLAASLRFSSGRTEAIAICELLLAQTQETELLLLLGNLYQEEDQFDQAIEYLERVILLSKPTASRLSCLGIAYFRRGDIDHAIELFERAIALQPDYADGHFHLGMGLLLQGNYARGWNEYEYRPFGRRRTSRAAVAIWHGQALHGSQTLLLVAEQGFGDTIQFVRFATEVKRRYGCRLLLQAPDKLHPLLSTCAGIDQFVSRDEPVPRADFYLPLASLPSCLDWRPGDRPNEFPYLFPQVHRVQYWKQRLNKEEPFRSNPRWRVGIAWQGDPKFPADRSRSIPLTFFEPLFGLTDIQFVSLQQNFGSEQLEAFRSRHHIVDFGGDLDREGGAFIDTIALIRHLDLVITSDTAIAHLAGAAGCKTWLGLSLVPDWRWNLSGNRSVWYPSIELFRQREAGDWSSVFERMRQRLDG